MWPQQSRPFSSSSPPFPLDDGAKAPRREGAIVYGTRRRHRPVNLCTWLLEARRRRRRGEDGATGWKKGQDIGANRPDVSSIDEEPTNISFCNTRTCRRAVPSSMASRHEAIGRWLRLTMALVARSQLRTRDQGHKERKHGVDRTRKLVLKPLQTRIKEDQEGSHTY